jgi:hypothetical protein
LGSNDVINGVDVLNFCSVRISNLKLSKIWKCLIPHFRKPITQLQYISRDVLPVFYKVSESFL